MLDQYANLSPKVNVEYVDPDKPAAGARCRSTRVRNCGGNRAKKDTAKSMTEEASPEPIRNLKGTTRTVCFVTGSGEHAIDDTERDGLSQFKDLLAKDEYEAKAIDLLQKAEVPATAPPWSSRARRTIISSRRWMQSRSMSRMAAGVLHA